MTKERKQFFFEKKNQKTITRLVTRLVRSVRIPKSQSFLVLFFKKELLPSFLLSVLLSTASDAQSIKLATWNLNWFTTSATPAERPADAPHRTAADIAALRGYADHLDADVIAFEEVDGATSAAALFPPDHYNIITIHQAVTQQVGLAVRRPIAIVQHQDVAALDVVPPEAPFRLRYGLDATLSLAKGRTLRLLVVHLKTGCITDMIGHSARHACGLLSRQVAPLAAWLAARAAENVAFAILGDFNRDFDKPETLSDALFAAAPLLRVTQGASDPCWGGGAFIDHIFLGGSARAWLVPASLRVLTYRSHDPADRERLSDHCPISIRLRPG